MRGWKRPATRESQDGRRELECSTTRREDADAREEIRSHCRPAPEKYVGPDDVIPTALPQAQAARPLARASRCAILDHSGATPRGPQWSFDTLGCSRLGRRCSFLRLAGDSRNRWNAPCHACHACCPHAHAASCARGAAKQDEANPSQPRNPAACSAPTRVGKAQPEFPNNSPSGRRVREYAGSSKQCSAHTQTGRFPASFMSTYPSACGVLPWTQQSIALVASSGAESNVNHWTRSAQALDRTPGRYGVEVDGRMEPQICFRPPVDHKIESSAQSSSCCRHNPLHMLQTL